MHDNQATLPPPIADTATGVHEKVVALLASQKPGRLLDVPTGEGAFALRAIKQGHEVVCGDIAPARFRLSEVECVQLDLNQPWPLEANAFDYVVSIEAVEHLENPWHLIREANRVLKPGGALILTTPNILSVRSRLSYLLYGYPNYFHYMVEHDHVTQERIPLDHINPVTFLELRHILSRCGFQIETIEANQLIKQRSFFFNLLKRLMLSRGRSQVQHDERKAAVRDILLSEKLLFGEILIFMAKKISGA